LPVADVAFRSYQTINLLVTSKHPRPQWFSIDEATNLVHNGLGYIDWASTDQGQEPDVVFAAAGSEPTWEVFAAVSLLHDAFPELRCVSLTLLIS
jgi:Phosphoketolase